jgi:hypothetical protein
MQFDEVLRTFSEFFEREGVRFAVVGGLAVHAWGGSRYTKDVDVLIERSDRERVLAFAESMGYETLNVNESFSNHEHSDPRLGRIDILYVNHETAEKMFAATSVKPIVGDYEGPVASPEHLAMMKGLAMKNFPHRTLYEPEDVRILLAVPGVNRDAVRDYYERIGMLELFNGIDKAR